MDLVVNVDETKLDDYVIKVKDFCLINGLILLTKSVSDSKESVHDSSFPLPVTLVPSWFPKREFDFANSLQPHFQELVFAISNDFDFLRECLEDVIKVDEFTRRLWNIYETVNSEGVSQPISLSILRNDYMVDLNKSKNSLTALSQIELNTISCSFGAATSKLTELHNHSLRFTNNKEFLQYHPKNENLTGLATALVKTWKLYKNPKAKLVFLVSSSETNIGDQRLLEYKCLDLEPNLEIRRYTIEDFANHGSLDQNKNLIIDENEIGLVYFRSTYDPSHFSNDKDWNARLMIERSRAIKCPNIGVHLAGTKIVQQALTEPNILSRFFKDEAISNRMKATFVDIHSIHDRNLSQIVDLINSRSEEFVLKPQREGGGHNIYKSDIKKYVESLENKSNLKAYILMKLVRPQLGRNYIVRVGRSCCNEELISEIGIFGYYISDGSALVANETTGYLLRSKVFGVNEGGVAAGYGALDSVLLI